MEASRKEIGAHEDDKDCDLVIRRELNGNKTIMSICYFKRERSPDGILINQKSFLCAYGVMKKLGINYWYI